MEFDSFENLYKNLLTCQKCSLCETRKNIVFENPPKISIPLVMIGEGPGATEDEMGRPFVGRSGMLLRKLLSQVGIKDEDIYITNMVKCRPPQNRNPKVSEINACSKYLQNELAMLEFKLVLCVGRVSAQSIIDKKFFLQEQHGKIILKDGISYMGVYHPAAILRNKWLFPELQIDLQKVRDFIYNG